jgi:iron complex outermembrane receptor protein
MNRNLLASAICASLLVAGAAYAQDNPASQPQDQSTAQSSTAQQQNQKPETKTLETVTVSGSLLKRPEYQTTVPVQVVPIQSDVAAGMFNVTDFVQSTAAAAGSTQINGQFGGYVIEGGTGVKPIDLRGLGANRTLVLLDGQRPGPAGTRGQVNAFDLNVIPRAIIQRIEVVKDGSSSIYGSDAIAGVVNLITKKRLDKTYMDFFVSAPEDGGGEQYQASIATGWNFKNGNITVAAEVDRQNELKTGQRDYFSCFQNRYFNAAGQRVDIPDHSINEGTPYADCNNLLVQAVIDPFSDTGARYVPSKDGSTGPNSPVPGYVLSKRSTYRTSATPFNDQVTDFPQYDETYAINRNQSATAYLASTFTFGSVNWDTQVLLNRRTTNSNGWRQFFPVVFNDNGWSTADSSFYGGSDTKYSGFQPVMLFPSNDKITVDYGYFRTGLNGGFGNSSWSWAANASYSRSNGDYDALNISLARSGDWNRSENEVLGRSLVNYFDPGYLDGSKMNELIGAVGQWTHGNTVFEQKLANVVVNGNLFNLPAGPVAAAFGAEYRHTSLDDVPPPATWGKTTAGETKGADHVTEVFGEVGVPILKGLPGVDSLSADLSAREFKYGSVGSSSHVWKYGLNWQVIPSFRIRGTIGTSYRAPALYELYLANQTGFVGQLSIDPCVDWQNSSNPNVQKNCAAAGIPGNYTGGGSSAMITQGGGKGFLTPETSRAKSLGFVWSPSFADLQVAFDYFDYNIRGEISTLSGSTIVNSCYSRPLFPNDFCNRFTRNPATGPNPYNITNVYATYINVNQQRDRGYDLQLNFAKDLPFGRLSVDGEVTYTLEHIQRLFSSAAASGFDTTNYTGSIGNPRVIGIVNTSLKRGDWSFNWQAFFTSATDDYAFADEVINYSGLPDTYRYLRAGAQVRHSVSVGYDQGDIGVMFGIRNVTNRTPPLISNGAPENYTGNTVIGASQYDWFGRTYFARLSIKI